MTVLDKYPVKCDYRSNRASVSCQHGNPNTRFPHRHPTGMAGQVVQAGRPANRRVDRTRHAAARRAHPFGARVERTGGSEHRHRDAGVSRAGKSRPDRSAPAIRLLRSRKALVAAARAEQVTTDAQRHARERERSGDGGAQGDPLPGVGGFRRRYAESAAFASRPADARRR